MKHSCGREKVVEKNRPFSLTFCRIVALMLPHRSVVTGRLLPWRPDTMEDRKRESSQEQLSSDFVWCLTNIHGWWSEAVISRFFGRRRRTDLVFADAQSKMTPLLISWFLVRFPCAQ